jgi:hypothetical protein
MRYGALSANAGSPLYAGPSRKLRRPEYGTAILRNMSQNGEEGGQSWYEFVYAQKTISKEN